MKITKEEIEKLSKINQTKFAIFCAEQVLPIFEKAYPDDKKPRKAVEAAKDYAAAYAAAYAASAYAASAYAASATAYAAAYSAAAAYAYAADAADAAACAADSDQEIKNNIQNFFDKLIQEEKS